MFRFLPMLGCLVTVMASSAACRGQAYPFNSPLVGSRSGTFIRPPVLSPYLGLTQGRNPAVNYFQSVVPQQRFFSPYVNQPFNLPIGPQLERELLPTNPENQPLVPALSGTGHPTQFVNYTPYYNFATGVGSGPTYTNPSLGGKRGR